MHHNTFRGRDVSRIWTLQEKLKETETGAKNTDLGRMGCKTAEDGRN